MTPEEWEIWKRINASAEALPAYPDLERQDFDEKAASLPPPRKARDYIYEALQGVVKPTETLRVSRLN